MIVDYPSLDSSIPFQCQVLKGYSPSILIRSRWHSDTRTSSVAVHCGSCCCQGWKKVSERAKGDLKVSASMTGQIGCLEAATNKTECQQTPLKLAGIFLKQQCVICVIEAFLPILGITVRKWPHCSRLTGSQGEGCPRKTSPTRLAKSLFSLMWKQCMSIKYLALYFS